jgi:hypothetical protein
MSPLKMAHVNTSKSAVCLAFLLLTLMWTSMALADGAAFDLKGPMVEMNVTRAGKTLPIGDVANLRAGDRLWIHPALPDDQSVHYLLVVAFLRGTTNPPPENWFVRAETWKQETREEGIVVTVPTGAQQALLFLAPETGGDFSTLRSAVRSKPGAFVRASQDLNQVLSVHDSTQYEESTMGLYTEVLSHCVRSARTAAMRAALDSSLSPEDAIRSKHGNNSFFSFAVDNGELHTAFLDVHDGLGRVTLCEDRLIFLEFPNLSGSASCI